MKSVRIITQVIEDDRVLEENAITIPLYETSRDSSDNIVPSILDPQIAAERARHLADNQRNAQPLLLRKLRGKLKR